MNKEEQKLASKGEGGDNVIGHLTKGDTVIPHEVFLANPALAQHVHDSFVAAGADPAAYIVGSSKQNINPKTGIPEFGWFSFVRNFVEKAAGAAAGFAVGGPAGAAIGAGLVGGVQGDRGLQLVGDAAGGYFGGGTAFDVGSGIVNSGVGAVTGTVGTYGTGSTIGSLAAGAASSLSSAGNSVRNLVSGAGSTLSGGPGGLTSAELAAKPLMTTAGTAATGGGTTAAAGYGSDVLSKLNSAPSWLAPVASLAAGGLQYQGTQNAIGAEKDAQLRQQAIEQPYVNAGRGALAQETNLVENPQAQADYVKNNPLYNTLATDAATRLTANEASKGKLGSGGTAKALQDQLLTLGTGLVNNQVANLHNITNTGANAAAGVGNGIINTGNNMAQLHQDAGTNLGAGAVGAANGVTSNYDNQINTLLALQRLRQPSVAMYTPQ